ASETVRHQPFAPRRTLARAGRFFLAIAGTFDYPRQLTHVNPRICAGSKTRPAKSFVGRLFRGAFLVWTRLGRKQQRTPAGYRPSFVGIDIRRPLAVVFRCFAAPGQPPARIPWRRHQRLVGGAEIEIAMQVDDLQTMAVL